MQVARGREFFRIGFFHQRIPVTPRTRPTMRENNPTAKIQNQRQVEASWQ